MISEILPITETKLDILSVLYQYTELNLAEISKKIKISSSNILKTIPKLIQILNIKKIGNIKLYSINKQYLKEFEPLIESYRINKSLGIHTQLLNKIENIYQIENMYLFGSFAKEIQNENSDLDLIIITNKKEEVVKEIKIIQKISPFIIEPLYLTKEEFEKEMKNQNSRFKKIIEDKSLRIKIK